MRTHGFVSVVAVTAIAGIAPTLRGDLVYLTQSRAIQAATTADAALLTATAPGFGPFVETLTSVTTFATASGPATNLGETTIDCQLDPNAIRATGSLTGSGGLNITGNLEAGEAAADILVTFTLAQATPFSMFCTPRPSTDPRDEFQIEFFSITTTNEIFRITETDPAQTVNISGMLPAGDYSLQFTLEMTSEGPQQTRSFDFQLLVPSPGAAVLFAAAPLVLARRRR